jgi:PPM family protein phosphatase
MSEPSWGLTVHAGSRLGRRRANQDRVAHGGRTLAVADGVGGGRHGDVAAQVALGAVLVESACLEARDEVVGAAELSRIVSVANQHVVGLAEKVGRGAETTVSLVHVSRALDGRLVAGVAWVGDSPVFLATTDAVEQLTLPHVTPVDGSIAGGAQRLVRTLGSSQATPSICLVDLRGWSRLVLATDGLLEIPLARRTGIIGDRTLSAGECVAALLGAADESGGRDNTAVGVLEVQLLESGIDRSALTSVLGPAPS